MADLTTITNASPTGSWATVAEGVFQISCDGTFSTDSKEKPCVVFEWTQVVSPDVDTDGKPVGQLYDTDDTGNIEIAAGSLRARLGGDGDAGTSITPKYT